MKKMKVKSRIVKAHDQEFIINDIEISSRLSFVSVLRKIIHNLRTLFKLIADFPRSIFSEIKVRTIKKYAKNESAFNEHNNREGMQANRFTRSVKARYDKVNFVYRNPSSIHSAYMYFRGLKTALERNGLLYYSYDVSGSERLDLNALLKYPMLCITGSHKPVFDVVQLVNGKQFTAEINSESLHTAQGDMDDIYYDSVRDKSNYFDMYFTPAEIDLNSYFGKPCYWMPSWVHVELLDDISPSIYDKLGFIGYVGGGGREEFFAKDKNRILLLANTVPCKDALENTIELCKLINKFKILVTPMGVRFMGMTGKTYEYMACKRLCLCYLNEINMFKTKLLFEDGKDIVFFKTFEEMEEKYNYYIKNQEAANKIALAGYYKVRTFHNADVRAKRFAKLVLHHANGGKYDVSFNNISVFGGKPLSKNLHK